MWPLFTRENVKYQEIAKTLLPLRDCLGKCDVGDPVVCCMLISGYSSLGLRDYGILPGLPLPGSQALLFSSPQPLSNLSLAPTSPSLGAWNPSQSSSALCIKSFEERQALSGSVGSFPHFPRTKRGQAWDSPMIKNKLLSGSRRDWQRGKVF